MCPGETIIGNNWCWLRYLEPAQYFQPGYHYHSCRGSWLGKQHLKNLTDLPLYFWCLPFAVVIFMVSMSTGLDDIYVISSNGTSGDFHAKEEILLTHVDMNLTICWWYKPYAGLNPIITLLSMSTQGMNVLPLHKDNFTKSWSFVRFMCPNHFAFQDQLLKFVKNCNRID